MKKQAFIITLFAFICSFCTFGQGQENSEKLVSTDLKFGVKAGANFSRAFGDIGSNESFLLDFNVGGIVRIPTSLIINIQIEPQLSRVGASRDSKVLRRYTFLDIPVVAQFSPIDNLSFEAGPKMAVTLDQKQRQQSGDLETVDRLKAVTLGATGGTTYNFDDNWFGQFRISYWFSDIIRKDGGDSEGTSLLLFQLSVGYWLN